MKLKIRFRRWNEWRKGSLNSGWHKLLVLIGVRQSPTFNLLCATEELRKTIEEAVECIKDFSERTVRWK